MNLSKVISAAVVIFLAGATTGALVSHHWTGRPPPAKEPSITELMDRLDRELTLSMEQRAAIQKWIQGGQENMKRLWEGIEPEATAVKAKLFEHILGELDQKQCDKFDQVFKINSGSSNPKSISTPEQKPPAPTLNESLPVEKLKNQPPAGASHGNWQRPPRAEQPEMTNPPVAEQPASGV